MTTKSNTRLMDGLCPARATGVGGIALVFGLCCVLHVGAAWAGTRSSTRNIEQQIVSSTKNVSAKTSVRPNAQLERARKLYDAMEYDAVLPLVDKVLAAEDTNLAQRLRAYELKGCTLAIMGDFSEAEGPFRLLLRGRPDFDLPEETSPRILPVFRKVQMEERAIAEQMHALEHKEIVDSLVIKGEPPSEPRGGLPMAWKYTLRDPRGAVSTFELHYRRAGEPDFSSLALKQDETGRWTGELPGEWTASQEGFTLEYFLRTADSGDAELLRRGDAGAPLSLRISPGTVAEGTPLVESELFWAAVGVAAVAVGVASYFLHDYLTGLPDDDIGVYDMRR